MPFCPSRLLRLLREGRRPTVLTINLSDPRGIEIAGMGGVDGVRLCTEHVPHDWIGLENQVRAARLHGIDALVRVARGGCSDYVRPLEMDAAGLFAPLPALVAEGFNVFNVDADVVGLGQYVRQRVEFVEGQEKALVNGSAPGARSPYA